MTCRWTTGSYLAALRAAALAAGVLIEPAEVTALLRRTAG